jgi:hypothetical protein
MTTDQNTYPAASYRIIHADFRSGRVTVIHPDGREMTVTAKELEAASSGGDAYAATYRELHARAKHEIEASRRASMAQCASHSAERSGTYGYSAPIPRAIGGEEPRAHGNVCEVEHCRCGAVRAANINQRWVEQGPWD